MSQPSDPSSVTTLRIHINDEWMDVPGPHLIDLLTHLNLKTHRGIAVAVNHTVVPKTKWSHTIIRNEDRIHIIHATQGG